MTLQDCATRAVERCPRRYRMPDDDYNATTCAESLQETCIEHGWSYCHGPRSFSVVHKPNRQRWLHLATIEHDGLPVGDFEAAGELAGALNERIGVWHRGSTHDHGHFVDISAPGTWHYYYCKPRFDADLVYLDLKRAYFQIYSSVAAWDIRYRRGSYLAFGHVEIPQESLLWLRENRSARNGLIGVAGARYCEICLPDGRTIKAPTFGRSNYQLALLVLDTLQSIMFETHVKFSAQIDYINTDGLICSPTVVDSILDFWRDRWGMVGCEKARGRGEIREIGAYRLGDTVSGTWAKSHVMEGTMLTRTRGIRDIARHLHKVFAPYLKSRPAGIALS